MTHTLPALPYSLDALEPYISSQTLSFHHGKHHNTYIQKLNELIQDSELDNKSLEEILVSTFNKPNEVTLFNNAAQVWNHSFYWQCMTPESSDHPNPSGRLMEKINTDFGSFASFLDKFKQAGLTQFGSGWAWLVLDNGVLKVTKTSNADLPLVHGQQALLTMDVWEHAYYLDYQNRRGDYINTYLEKLVNWDFVESNLAKAK
uniref:Superoxide dismutase n=1 Tax=Paulinella chromatophora TaxID=39717 RepID=B1X3S3_PAUCH|nr:superoxide dismutase [Paulinella chromatophora]ACB42592.1 superoxide dismutase [Paulinella chromatophora]